MPKFRVEVVSTDVLTIDVEAENEDDVRNQFEIENHDFDMTKAKIVDHRAGRAYIDTIVRLEFT